MSSSTQLIDQLSRRNFMVDKAAMVVSERDVGLVVQTALECAGFECEEFNSTVALLRSIKRDDLRLIILDTDGQDVDWRAVLEWRNNWLNPAVLVLAIGSADTKATVRALEAGADDYVAKPIRGAELVARLNAAARRRDDTATTNAMSVAGCTVDPETCSLRSTKTSVALTGREFALMQILFENVGKLVTRQRLATEVWGARSDLSGRTIEQHIYQVRRKLKQCVGEVMCVRSIYGSGYRLDLTPNAGLRVANALSTTSTGDFLGAQILPSFSAA
jgi:DNA-binding response OmpR family regulator